MTDERAGTPQHTTPEAGRRRGAEMLPQLQFRHKLLIFPVLAAVAFAVIYATVWFIQRRNATLTDRVNVGYLAAWEVNRDLHETLDVIQRVLQDAATSAEPDDLLAADSLSAYMLTRLADGRANPVIDRRQHAALEAAFRDYYPWARATTQRLIDRETGEVLATDVERMRARYTGVAAVLDTSAARARADMQRAFAEMERNTRTSMYVVTAVTVLCLGLLATLSLLLIRTLHGPLSTAVLAADRIARGDTSPEIRITSADEFGQLAQAMKGMVDYLRDMARVAESIAAGDLSVRVAVRSPDDTFGRAFTVMTANLAAMIGSLRESEARNRELADGLRATRLRLEYLLGSSPAVVYSRDVADAAPVTFVSGNVTAQLGYAPGDFSDTLGFWKQMLHPEDVVLAHEALDRLRHEGSATVEYRVRDARGYYRWLHDEARVIRTAADDEAKDAEIVGSWVDVTERKNAEEALHQSAAELRQAQKMEAVGLLAGGVAHDFNNLLTVITSYATFLLEDLPDSGSLRDDVREIKVAAERATALTQQLLAFGRKQLLQPRAMSVNELAEGTATMLKRLIGADIQLITFLDPLVGSIVVDRGQIEQVLVNLAVNARDAMPDGGTLTIETSSADLDVTHFQAGSAMPPPGCYACLAVGDTGVGMTAATQAHIFEPFFTTKDVGRGTGLGLSTVFGIVKQSGGHITVESELGAGSVFRIYFPLAVPGEVAPMSDGSTPRAGAATSGETVLVVEDEYAVRRLARRILEQAGYLVLEARHGADALAVVHERSSVIDLVLTDLVMPEMGGRELAEQLRRDDVPVRLLFMSGYTNDDVVRRGLLDPTMAFLQKPFSADELREAVRAALDTPLRSSAPPA